MHLTKIKKVSAIALTTILLSGPILNTVDATEPQEQKPKVISMNRNGNIYTGEYELDNNMIEYSLNKDTSVLKQYVMNKDTEEKNVIEYNINEGIILIDDIEINIETKFTYIDKDTYSSEEEALRIHNEQIMDSFIDSVSDYKTKSSVSQYVPSNAAYKTLGLIDKKMSLGSKKIGSHLSTISILTGVLSYLPGIPQAALLGMVSQITDQAGDILKLYDATMTVTWKYGQDQTTNKYNLGPSGYNYAFRFRHSNVKWDFTMKGKNYLSTKPYTKVGTWFS